MTRSRVLAAVTVAGFLALLGAGPASASESQAPGCDIRDATLTWGFKESFRAYIDGDIANGEWTTSDGAAYETPEFIWSGGTGRYNSDTGSGSVQFSGSVRFTGHDGLLDTTISNPVVTLSGDTGTLILDVAGPSMDGDQVDAQDVPFVELRDLEISGEDALVTVDAGTVMTSDGEAAFPDYQAGTDFDPVALNLPTSGECAAGLDGGDAGPADGGAIDPALVLFAVLAPLTLIIVVAMIAWGRRARA
jgi:hypothetical protein